MTVSSYVTAVTPSLAKDWLGKNNLNRGIRQHHVDRLARDMVDDKWLLTGEAIKFNSEGDLVDGQHRLRALIKAHKTIQTMVVHGVESEAQSVMDTGSKRSLRDVLKFAGEEHHTYLASALVNFWLLSNKRMRSTGAPSNQEALSLLREHPGLRDSIAPAQRCYSAVKSSQGLITALHYAASQVDPEDADYFFEHLASGAGLAEKDAIWVLREKLKDDAIAVKKMPKVMVVALIIKSWNSFREGREVKTLRWRMGGASPEGFPELA